jgi:predicted  nucleic acid-binding Zn-ribbon protein
MRHARCGSCHDSGGCSYSNSAPQCGSSVTAYTEETQAEVRQVLPLLRESVRVLKVTLDREGQRYDAYEEAAEATKQ